MATQNPLLMDRKRTRTWLDIMTTNLDSPQICSWPRFLLVKGTDDERPLCRLSSFAVNKAIVAILGSDPFNIKKLRNGNILVEVDKEAQSNKQMKTTKLNLTMDNAIPIEVQPHYSLNTKKGVIRCPDIKECTDEEILEGLKDEGVIKLDRITVFRDGNRKQTGTFILTFQRWVITGWLCHSLFLILSDVINVRNLATQNSTAGKMKYAINVGKRITLTLRNVKTKQNVSTAREIMHQMTNHVQNGKKRIFKG